MHELGITQEIVAIALDQSKGRNVRRIVVEIGRLTAVLPDAVRFCFDLCTEGTPAEGAELDIVEVAARGRCRSCTREQAFEQAFGICSCGSSNLDWIAGEELKVQTVEVI
jgi:hydrogenase nickel incorporation protein HypA/HybF